eukprot:scaffold30928_cov30-Cyclotella_meneghiniana.AAC.4
MVMGASQQQQVIMKEFWDVAISSSPGWVRVDANKEDHVVLIQLQLFERVCCGGLELEERET